MVQVLGLLGLLLAVALDERTELLSVGLALLGQGVAGMVDVRLFGVGFADLPEPFGQVELGPVQVTEVVGEVHRATPSPRTLRPRRLCRPRSPAPGRRKQGRRQSWWVPVRACHQRRRPSLLSPPPPCTGAAWRPGPTPLWSARWQPAGGRPDRPPRTDRSSRSETARRPRPPLCR